MGLFTGVNEIWTGPKDLGLLGEISMNSQLDGFLSVFPSVLVQVTKCDREISSLHQPSTRQLFFFLLQIAGLVY